MASDTRPARAVLAGVPVGGEAPVVLIGALNVSPESFWGGSVHTDPAALRAAALAMVEAGAALVDVGARSTAPYRAGEIDEAEETRRLARAVDALVPVLPVPVSVDTTRAAPARAAFDAGARVLNDVSGLADPRLAALAAERGVGCILGAVPAGPPPPGEPLTVLRALLDGALARARAVGIADERVVLDPAIGFFRAVPMGWVAWDLRVLAGLPALAALGRPLCVGVSRKSFLGAITGRAEPGDRLAASLAATAVAVLRGAAAIRTHDVAETRDAVRVAERLRAAGA